ncbi:hypothetical protein B0H17DRAFT_1277772 [Mycena rosella]|uniref:Uncharacterized protein n=1 Tax=Mycena rosella TaxID=1033263 RepID=A0AAD7C323_MYCRO|nr:hypothetical protein B0H17DRAFT_1277772 [Mycena rosella]
MSLNGKGWKKAETNRGLGYNKHAESTLYRHAQKKRENEAEAAVARESAQSKAFTTYFQPRVQMRPQPSPSSAESGVEPHPLAAPVPLIRPPTPPLTPGTSATIPQSIPPYLPPLLPVVNDILCPIPHSYLSDEPSEPEISDEDDDDSDREPAQSAPKKRRKLDISVRDQKRLKKEQRRKEYSDALTAIEKLISLKRTQYQSPLQGKRARTAVWVKKRDLPESDRGRHAKTWSLLNDPEIKEELTAYLRSNKWSMNPEKLVEYSKAKLVTDEMKQFIQNAVNKEMPRGLKKYLEVELFPRIGYKVVRGISLTTARQWLHDQGFEYTEVKKGLFYDGHERPDNVDYRQNQFIPAFDALRPYLVEYQVGKLDKLVEKPPPPPGQFWLVLTAHDEMTAQANDGQKAVWIMKGENPIRKKGVGRGVHRNDIICSTFGHVVEAGQGIEYGKNHDGYWDGAQFIKQLEDRIIPAFERLHDRNIYRACFLIDNSQGHCAYSEDALVVTRMNWRPGGKQASMRDGWFWFNGRKVPQQMVSSDGKPKGMKMVLEERGLWRPSLKMKCDTARCKIPLEQLNYYLIRVFWLEDPRLEGLDQTLMPSVRLIRDRSSTKPA